MDKAPDKGRQSALRYGRWSIPNHAYFITKCLEDKGWDRLVLSEYADILINSFLWARDSDWWRILGFVIMPNHYHIAIGLKEVKTLSEVVASVDQYTARQINRRMARKGRFWQSGFYDHAIRDREEFSAILAYMHTNPVKAELVEVPEAWPYSTAAPRYAREIDWEWVASLVPRVLNVKHRFTGERSPM